MLKTLRLLALLLFLPGLAWAQTSPGLFNGQVPTAAQWNSYFQKKQDYPVSGYCPDQSLYGNFTGAIAPARCFPYSTLPGAPSALKWTTARTLTVTGDIAITTPAFDGSANFAATATLPNIATPATCTYSTVVLNAKGQVTGCTTGTAPGGGTVTSIGVTLPGTFSCTGSPVTTSGTIACSYATQTANTVFAGPTSGGAATPAFRPLVAADLPATAVTPGSYTNLNATIDAGGRITAASNGSAGGASSPQGRLTLVTGTPVMNSDQTAKSQVFYDCYRGKQVPYYDGSTDQTDTIASCEVSFTMATSSTGVTNSGGVFDVYWVHSGASRVCVVTNGSGGGWASDTAGSNTARGTGYSAVHNTRGYWTNTNALTHCYNGATDYGSVSADQGTYLGTLYTTAAGQTGMQQVPSAAAGGSNSCLCLYNAYNRVHFNSISLDSNSSWVYASNTVRAMDNSTSNRVSWVDGLQQSPVLGAAFGVASGGNGSSQPTVLLGLNSTTSTIATCSRSQPSFSPNATIGGSCNVAPQMGFNYAQGLEAVANTAASMTFIGFGVFAGVSLSVEM